MSTNIFKTVRGAVKNWYVPLIIGLILIGVGVWTFAQPSEAYVGLAMVFSVAFVIIGLLEMYYAFSNRETLEGWGWPFAFGILALIVGIIMLKDPQVSMVTMPFYVGFAIMFRSIGAIGYAYDLKGYGVMDWGNLLAVGILGLLFSFMLLWNPSFAGLSIVVWTGLAFIFVGIFSIYLSFKLKDLHTTSEQIMQKFDDAAQNIKDKLNIKK